MLDKIVAIIYEAGKIVKNAQQIERVTTEKDGAANLVTQYDEAAQAFLKEKPDMVHSMTPKAGLITGVKS